MPWLYFHPYQSDGKLQIDYNYSTNYEYRQLPGQMTRQLSKQLHRQLPRQFLLGICIGNCVGNSLYPYGAGLTPKLEPEQLRSWSGSNSGA